MTGIQKRFFLLAFGAEVVYFIINIILKMVLPETRRLRQPLSGAGLVLAITLCCAVAAAVSGPRQEETDQAEQQLDRLRSEIQEFEQRLKDTQHREKDLLSELEDFDREIALRTELIHKLEQ